ncbi:hypothetical protein [Actinoplanes sp. NPDC051411]|uniref:hypothetical protein n=1 Tax=Actinoplanes sp. NPDC051411 TaxID=3155522 RepID=UPI00341351CA
MRKNLPAALVIAVAFCSVSGCAGSEPGQASRTSANASGASRPAVVEVLPLDFARSGGLAGLDARLHITDDGWVTVTNDGVTGQPKALDASRIATLKQALADVTPSKPRSVTTAIHCADGFKYLINTPSWTVTTDDCVSHTPAFDRALTLLLPLLQPGATDPVSPIRPTR